MSNYQLCQGLSPASNSNQLEKAKNAPQSITLSAPALVNLPPAFPYSQPPIRAYMS